MFSVLSSLVSIGHYSPYYPSDSNTPSEGDISVASAAAQQSAPSEKSVGEQETLSIEEQEQREFQAELNAIAAEMN